MEARQLAIMAKDLARQAGQQNGLSFVATQVEVSSMDALRKLASDTLKELHDGAVLLTAVIQEKANVALALSEAAQNKGLDAAKFIKERIAPLIKGGGGGNKSLATAGGQNAGNLAAVIEELKALL